MRACVCVGGGCVCVCVCASVLGRLYCLIVSWVLGNYIKSSYIYLIYSLSYWWRCCAWLLEIYNSFHMIFLKHNSTWKKYIKKAQISYKQWYSQSCFYFYKSDETLIHSRFVDRLLKIPSDCHYWRNLSVITCDLYAILPSLTLYLMFLKVEYNSFKKNPLCPLMITFNGREQVRRGIYRFIYYTRKPKEYCAFLCDIYMNYVGPMNWFY